MSRTTSRKHAFCIIFQMPFNTGTEPHELAEAYFVEGPGDLAELTGEDREFILAEVGGAACHLEDIDELIARHLTGWGIERLAKVDLAILRLSVYELCYDMSIPTAVSINEAVELAKMFGDGEASSFVNGILGKIATLKRGVEA